MQHRRRSARSALEHDQVLGPRQRRKPFQQQLGDAGRAYQADAQDQDLARTDPGKAVVLPPAGAVRPVGLPDLSARRADVSAGALAFNAAPWQRFHLRPEPQGHGSLRPRLASALA